MAAISTTFHTHVCEINGREQVFTSPTYAFMPTPPAYEFYPFNRHLPEETYVLAHLSHHFQHIPFLPRLRRQHPLSRLSPAFNILSVSRTDDGQYIADAAQNLSRLEDSLYNFQFQLLSRLWENEHSRLWDTAVVRPARIYGYNKKWPTAEEAQQRLQYSHQAFYNLYAQCSLAIHYQYGPDASMSRQQQTQAWQEHMLSGGKPLTHDFVQTLTNSWVGDQPVLRVGCFLSSANPPSTALWDAFTSAQVPVFIHWSKTQSPRCSPTFLRYRPSPTSVEEAKISQQVTPAAHHHTFPNQQNEPASFELTEDWNPIVVEYPPNENNNNELPVAPREDVTYCDDPLAFFERRWEAGRRREATEDPAQWRDRLNRERSAANMQKAPGRGGGTVFEWEKDDLLNKWFYVCINQGDVADHWELHSSSQRFFDSHNNEWHLCDLLAPNSPASIFQLDDDELLNTI